MKLNLTLIIIIFLCIPQMNFAQKKKQDLSNTYWKIIMHFGNADTWTLVPLNEKPNPDIESSFLEFDKKNGFHIRLNFGCIEDASGEYHIVKSHIYFSTKKSYVEQKCNAEDANFWPNKMAIIRKKGFLYLTQPTDWYDEKTLKNRDTILINSKQLGRGDTNEEGKHFITDANQIPLDDGTYKVFSKKETERDMNLIFTQKNGVFDGLFISKSKDIEAQNLFKEGKILSEKRWKNNQLTFEKTNLEHIIKNNDGIYVITLTEIKKNLYRNEKDSIITIFHNTKPIMKTRYENNKLVSQKNFQKKTFKKYNQNGRLLKSEDSGVHIEYDYEGKERKKEIYQPGTYELYKYGILNTKKIYYDNKTKTILYDKNGNIIDTKVEEYYPIAEIGDMDEFESELTNEQFNNYKKQLH